MSVEAVGQPARVARLACRRARCFPCPAEGLGDGLAVQEILVERLDEPEGRGIVNRPQRAEEHPRPEAEQAVRPSAQTCHAPAEPSGRACIEHKGRPLLFQVPGDAWAYEVVGGEDPQVIKAKGAALIRSAVAEAPMGGKVQPVIAALVEQRQQSEEYTSELQSRVD